MKLPVLTRFTWTVAVGGLALLTLALNLFSGPSIRIPTLFVVPVLTASLVLSRAWGWFYAILLPLIQWSFYLIWNHEMGWFFPLVNNLFRMAILSLIVYLTRFVEISRGLKKELESLQRILPICCFCKKIKNAHGVWQSLEVYFKETEDTDFSHGLCPECAAKHYGLSSE